MNRPERFITSAQLLLLRNWLHILAGDTLVLTFVSRGASRMSFVCLLFVCLFPRLFFFFVSVFVSLCLSTVDDHGKGSECKTASVAVQVEVVAVVVMVAAGTTTSNANISLLLLLE